MQPTHDKPESARPRRRWPPRTPHRSPDLRTRRADGLPLISPGWVPTHIRAASACSLFSPGPIGRRPRTGAFGTTRLLRLIVIAEITGLARLLNVCVVRILSRRVEALPVGILTALVAGFTLVRMSALIGHAAEYRLFSESLCAERRACDGRTRPSPQKGRGPSRRRAPDQITFGSKSCRSIA